MLVIVSDLHLKDGTSGTSITSDAFRIFAERMRDLAYRASWRAGDSVYAPITSIDLVMLCDVFDQIRSTKWLEVDGQPVTVRPWDDPNSPAFIQKINDINDGTLAYNARVFQAIKLISEGKGITLPPAVNGYPDVQSGERVTVKVNIYFMVGNHDWFFCLPGEPYNQMRQKVIDALGLANSSEPFPYAPWDSPVLAEVLGQHRVFARHGDFFDKMNYDPERGRAAATLGDAMAVELLDRFPYDVRKELEGELPPQFVEGLKELANVRPALVTPLWIGNLVNRYARDESQADKVKEIWNGLVRRFLDLDFVRSHDKKLKFDTVDALEVVLTISKELPFDTVNKMMAKIGEKLWGNKISIAKHALEEQAFLNQSARYIVYGHTHFHEVVPLDSNVIDGKNFDQVYINSGTWHSYHDLTLRDPSQHKFVPTHVMTYLTFFKDDERKNHAFETWSGSLAAATG
jgi:hypothetical protein